MPCFAEPSLSEVLKDPLIMTVMKADRVDVTALEKSLREVSGRIRAQAPKRNNVLTNLIAWS